MNLFRTSSLVSQADSAREIRGAPEKPGEDAGARPLRPRTCPTAVDYSSLAVEWVHPIDDHDLSHLCILKIAELIINTGLSPIATNTDPVKESFQ